MNSSTRIPPLLQPYVKLPRDDSLVLLTSTLGASANWLLIRFLYNALSNNIQDGGAVDGHNVILVSWMRDYDFWRQETRKGAGLDLERLKREKRFAFVDGLSELVMGQGKDAQTQQPANNGVRPARAPPTTYSPRTGNTLPVRGPPGRAIPARDAPTSAQSTSPADTITATPSPAPAPQSSATPPQGHFALTWLTLDDLKSTITCALRSLAPPTTSPPPRPTLLILDNPDAYLALSSTPPSSFTSLLLQLHSTAPITHILTHIQADTPLLTPSTPPQPLEIAHYNLLTKMAHMSSRILGTRVLDTGVARDVSGVVRVTEQSASWADLGIRQEGEGEGAGAGGGREFLYRVMGDGSVRVFERGAGGESQG